MVAVLMFARFSSNPSVTYVLRFVVLGLAYGILSYLSLLLIPTGASGASLVWSVAAVGLAGLLLWGIELWPALLAAFFFVLMARGIPAPVAAGAALGNTLEAGLGAYILMHAGFHPLMSRLQDTLGLILAAFLSTLVSSTVITGSAALLEGHTFSLSLWVGIWIGHTVSILSFGPFFIRWGYRPFFIKTAWEIAEGAALFGIIAAINFFMFWTPYGSVGGISLIYILIIPLIWASLRAGPRGTSLALFVTAVVGLSGILWGSGPITPGTPEALFAIQVLIGTLSIIFLLFTSLTEERKEAVIALGAQVDKLEVALERISSEDAAKGEFIAILAHELRNPLSPVLSGLEILKSRDQGAPDVLNMMGAHLNTLARLLDDLLDITRISQKKFRLEREQTTLRAILSRSLEMVEPYLTSRNHTFSLTQPEDDLRLDADPVRLAQVFVNLLNNAAKYTPLGGTISLSVAREGSFAVVRIKDNGQGIASERLKEVFEAFAGAAGRNRGPGGLHIGLSLAKRMVELHQGTLTVYSAGDGLGSEFIVRLPLPTTAMPQPTLPLVQKSRGRFSKEEVAAHAKQAGPVHVLVVDDNEAAATMLGTLLKHNGHQVSLAHTGLIAIEVASAARPHVALIDIGLPDIDGYEVAARLRKEFGVGIGLVALTGYSQQDDREKSREAGFDDHLVKPVSIVDVERALAQLKRN